MLEFRLNLFQRNNFWILCSLLSIILKMQKLKIAAFPNSVDPDKTAHNESSHLDLHCCTLTFEFIN